MAVGRSEFERRLAEKKSETVLRCLAEEIERQRAAELDQILEGAEDVEVPANLHREVMKLIRKEEAERKRARRNARVKTALKICACLLAAFAVVGTFLVTNVEAVREKVYELFYEEEKDYVEMNPVESPYDPNDIIPEDWGGFWYPEYLPEGYELAYADDAAGGKQLIFKKEEFLITLDEDDVNSVSILLDNSEGPPEKVDMEFGAAFYVKSGVQGMLNWTDHETIFLLEGELSKEELVKIAESLTYQKTNRTFLKKCLLKPFLNRFISESIQRRVLYYEKKNRGCAVIGIDIGAGDGIDGKCICVATG